MKTVSVRIPVEQAEQLQQLAPLIPGKPSLNGLVQYAIGLLLEIEAPVYLATAKAVREQLKPQNDRVTVIAR